MQYPIKRRTVTGTCGRFPWVVASHLICQVSTSVRESGAIRSSVSESSQVNETAGQGGSPQPTVRPGIRLSSRSGSARSSGNSSPKAFWQKTCFQLRSTPQSPEVVSCSNLTRLKADDAVGRTAPIVTTSGCAVGCYLRPHDILCCKEKPEHLLSPHLSPASSPSE